jgi:hypothetical protein
VLNLDCGCEILKDWLPICCWIVVPCELAINIELMANEAMEWEENLVSISDTLNPLFPLKPTRESRGNNAKFNIAKRF